MDLNAQGEDCDRRVCVSLREKGVDLNENSQKVVGRHAGLPS